MLKIMHIRVELSEIAGKMSAKSAYIGIEELQARHVLNQPWNILKQLK